MGLFNNKDKKTEDLKTTQEIKEISSDIENFPQPNSTNQQTTSQPELNLNQSNQQEQNFVNPFANNSTTINEQINQPSQNSALQSQNQPELSSNQANQFQQDMSINTTPEPIQTNQQQVNTPPIEELTNKNSNSENSIFNLNNQNSSSQLPSEQTPNSNPEPLNLNQTNNIQSQTTSQSDPIQQLQPNTNQQISKDQIQELVDETVEQVIEERWQDIVKKIEKVASWKEKQEQHMNLIKEDIVTMKDSFDKLEKRIVEKISSYDRNILDVNSEIKALEKVFQKITPTLVNNVNELSNIAKTFKDDSETEKLE